MRRLSHVLLACIALKNCFE